MRTTVTIDSDIYKVVKNLSRQNGVSISATFQTLLERGLQMSNAGNVKSKVDSRTGFPVLKSSRVITDDDVATLEDA